MAEKFKLYPCPMAPNLNWAPGHLGTESQHVVCRTCLIESPCGGPGHNLTCSYIPDMVPESGKYLGKKILILIHKFMGIR